MKKVYFTGIVALVCLVIGGCSPDNEAASNSSPNDSSSNISSTEEKSTSQQPIVISDGSDRNAVLPKAGEIYMRQIYAAPHGEQSFAVVNVTMKDEKILSANFDEFQYVEVGEEWEGVPNSSNALGENFTEKLMLISKIQNSGPYSSLMEEKAQSTTTWINNANAIISFVKGKTAAEVKQSIDELTEDNISDVVSSATFVDTKGYLEAIVSAAEAGSLSLGVEADTDSISTAQILVAPHGDQSFAVVTVAMSGDKIVSSYTDEFQYLNADGFVGVPNSDNGFGEGAIDGQILSSKISNNEAYSSLMKSNAGAKNSWLENITAISEASNGKTIEELKALINELDTQSEDSLITDVVSGATFVDTSGYLRAIVEAAEKASE